MAPLDVSVVVPVYNPGPDLEPCIDSLLGQSMPSDRYELIFADDGSTDGTAERLDRLALAEGHVRVIHEPNSGWAGRPRNVGTDAARGRYVQYVDQDDTLGPEALERLVTFADANAADIAIGKVTSNFRPVPHHLWRRNVERCSVRTAPLMTSLTPHKMFRTEFLRGHGLRFPEGRRRLEDQVFMTSAYFATDAAAILADYPCYFYNRRSTGGNAGAEVVDPRAYYANLREVLDIVEAQTSAGAFRDEVLGRFAQAIVRRVSGVLTDPTLPPGYAEHLFDEARGVVVERFPTYVIETLPAYRRSRLMALVAGDLEAARRVAIEAAGIQAFAEATKVRTSRHGWTLRIVSGMRRRSGEVLDLAADDAIETEVFARHRRTGVEWPIAELTDVRGEADVFPDQVAGGRALPRGRWQLGVRIHALGLSRTARLTLPQDAPSKVIPIRRGRERAGLEDGVVRVRPVAAAG